MDKKKIILSGMRPTGKLHIGHFVGALENWVHLQDSYQNYHLIADYHTLTTSLDTTNVYNDTIDMVIDWIACGIDPVLSPIFRQSKVKEHTELFLIFSMLITKARLEKNPKGFESAEHNIRASWISCTSGCRYIIIQGRFGTGW